jgi:hypothetical protein
MLGVENFKMNETNKSGAGGMTEILLLLIGHLIYTTYLNLEYQTSGTWRIHCKA